MKITHYTFLAVLCCLALWACDPNSSDKTKIPKENPTKNVEAESTEENDGTPGSTDTKIELSHGPINETFVKEGEEGNIAFISASNLSKSSYSAGLKELVFYPEKEMTERYSQISRLYPLGWSKSGNFAYVQYSMTYHLGHQMTYTVMNMNTGDTLWNEEVIYEITDDKQVEEKYLKTGFLESEVMANSVIIAKGDESDEELLEYIWLAGEEVVLKVLKKAGIIFNPSPQFQKQKKFQDISFDIEMKETEEIGEGAPIKYYLNSSAHKSVLISENYLHAFDTQVWGVLKNPDSETIAVLCRIKRQFFEMTNEVVPILVGYDVQ